MKTKYGSFQEADTQVEPDGSMFLKLPDMDEESLKDLPNVSVVTITKDRKLFIANMLYNWNSFIYPQDKLEWVIIDDTQDPEQDIERYLPQDNPRIKYFKLDTILPVDEKRNVAVSMASHDYIVHMDDDDYYFPDSIMAKIRVLLKYKRDAVLSTTLGIYNLMDRTSVIVSNKKESNEIAEGTLAYTKSYWEKHPFKGEGPNGTQEGKGFIGKNFKNFIKIHFLFNTISITHTQNVTGALRKFQARDNDTKRGDFNDIFPDCYIDTIENIRTMLLSN